MGGRGEKKKTWLPKFAAGEVVGEGMFTEPQSGSDMAGMKTTAVRDGDHYVINGSKAWITNANPLDLCLLIACVPGTGERPEFGVFLADADAPGVTKGKPFETLIRGCGNLADPFFDALPASEHPVLGTPPL